MGLHKSPHNRRKKSTKGKATYGMGSKISANHISDTRLISNYIRNSCNSIAKKNKSYDERMGKEPWIDIFPKKKYGFMKWPPGT